MSEFKIWMLEQPEKVRVTQTLSFFYMSFVKNINEKRSIKENTLKKIIMKTKISKNKK